MIDDELIREIANGQWFILALVMTLFFAAYAVWKPGFGKPYEPDWLDDRLSVANQLILSWLILFSGSTLRAGFIWLLLHCENAMGKGECSHISDHAYLMFVASAMALVGGLAFIRTLSPQPWRPWSWIGSMVACLGIPYIFYITGQWGAFAPPSGTQVMGQHHLGLVALSIVVACAASYVALDLSERARIFGKIRYLWLTMGSVVLGIGIWSMHFVAMLSFSLPQVVIHYDMNLTILSMVLPIVFCLLGIFAVTTDQRQVSYIAGGIIIGFGVAAMHYTGMAAMELSLELSYDPKLFLVSILWSVAASTGAVWLAFTTTTFWYKILAAVIEGIAIAGLHYIAMFAAIFHTGTEFVPAFRPSPDIGQVELALWVSIATMLIMVIGLLAAIYDRRNNQPLTRIN